MIDYERVGRAHEYFVSLRLLRTKAANERVSEKEKEGADLLESLSDVEMDALSAILAGQGWAIETIDDTMPGIAKKGRGWVLVRRFDARSSSLLTMAPAWDEVSMHGETTSATIYWFTFMLLILLSFLYERGNRAIVEVSGYVKAVFTLGELEDRIAEEIEFFRKNPLSQSLQLPVMETILGGEGSQATKRAQIVKRVKKFVDVLVKARLVEKYETDKDCRDTFRQTIVFAKQMELLYAAGLAHLVAAANAESDAVSPNGDIPKIMDEMLARRVDVAEAVQ